MKIAICISGQPRNFKQSHISLEKSILNQYNCDIYFHSWETSNFESTNFGGGNYQYQLNENDYNELIELYQPKKYILEQPIVFDASGYKCPIWRQPLNNTLSMFYSMYKSFQLVEGNYDYILWSEKYLNIKEFANNYLFCKNYKLIKTFNYNFE